MADRLSEQNELARRLSAATSRVEARRERIALAAAERDDLVAALAAAGMTHRQIAEIARMAVEHVALIAGRERRHWSHEGADVADPAPEPRPPPRERRPPGPHDAGEPAPNTAAANAPKAQQGWYWRRTNVSRSLRRALTLIGTLFVALPIGFLAVVFVLAAAEERLGNAVNQLLLVVLAVWIAWRMVGRLRRIVKAARDGDELWRDLKTVRARQGTLRSVLSEHGALGVGAAVGMLAVYVWRAGRPPRGDRRWRPFAQRAMAVLGGLIVALLVASGVGYSVELLTGSEIVGGIATYVALTASVGWGVVVARRRRRGQRRTQPA